MGASVFVGSEGQVTITHRRGTAEFANGLAIVVPSVELLTSAATEAGETFIRSFAPGTEIVVRLLPDGSLPGVSAFDSTGVQAQILTTSPTVLEVQWEDDVGAGTDADFDDAFTTIDGGRLRLRRPSLGRLGFG